MKRLLQIKIANATKRITKATNIVIAGLLRTELKTHLEL